MRRGPVPGGIADDLQAVQIIYRVRVTGGTLTDELDGTTAAAAWFSRDELSEFQVVELVEAGLQLLDSG